MMKQEFEKLVGKVVPDGRWETVELVYGWHPCISNVEGKQQMAMLYNLGWPIIEDMKFRAEAVKETEDAIQKMRMQVSKIREQADKDSSWLEGKIEEYKLELESFAEGCPVDRCTMESENAFAKKELESLN